MKLLAHWKQMRDEMLQARAGGKEIGVVPTMGYLHEGHTALVRRARQENDIVVLTVFVNPTQFGPHEDYNEYPRDIERDRQIAKREGVDYFFVPSVKEMYPTGYATYVTVEGLTDVLEGASRPGHFRGVTTVVMKLFQITQPHRAYFGQKDAQQLMVIKKMVEDLNLPVEIKSVPTVREPDGLAMSSRNAYLTEKERRDAAILYAALQHAQRRIQEGEHSSDTIVHEVRKIIGQVATAQIDYIDIVDPHTFRTVRYIEQDREYCIAAAVRIGKTRLIDNIFVIKTNNTGG